MDTLISEEEHVAKKAAKESERIAVEHALLVQRDHIIGLEAQVGRLEAENRRLEKELGRVRPADRLVTSFNKLWKKASGL